MEIGVYTLGDLCPDPRTGKILTAQQRLQEILEAARLADEAGLDVCIWRRGASSIRLRGNFAAGHPVLDRPGDEEHSLGEHDNSVVDGGSCAVIRGLSLRWICFRTAARRLWQGAERLRNRSRCSASI